MRSQKLFSWVRYAYMSQRRCLCSNTKKLTNAEVRQKRCELFQKEKERQFNLIRRIEKIEVSYKGLPDNCTLIMNKGLSTPFNCAMHIQELMMKRTALALVNGEPWDLHRPLTQDCELEFLHFKDENPFHVNQAFWRSCSFILGHILETAFKDEHYVELCSFPPPNVRSGSFVYDADLKMDNWSPTPTELRCLGGIGYRLMFTDSKFERLDVDASVAAEMFEDNRFKSAQIPAIAAKSASGTQVAVYKMGDTIDLSQGPMISSTALIGRYSISAVHQIESPDLGTLYRVQGLAVPQQSRMHYWPFENILLPRAAKLNSAQLPTLLKPTPEIPAEL